VYHGSLKPSTARLGFAAVSLFFLGINFIWLRLDRTPPAWDDSFYLTSSLVMHDALAEGGLPGYVRQFRTIMGTKPPLIAVLPTPVYLIFGRKPRAALLVNLGCLLILFASLYHLGKRHASRRAGLIALAVAATMPMFYGLSHWYLVECGLTAIVVMSIALMGEWKDSAGLRRLISVRDHLRARVADEIQLSGLRSDPASLFCDSREGIAWSEDFVCRRGARRGAGVALVCI
jgi:4-amino-4-deoxy-L-arabinose transferase-like glycosyltransferase